MADEKHEKEGGPDRVVEASMRKTLVKQGHAWEFPAMQAVKVDAAKRIRLPVLRPGDYYEPECLGPEEIVLRRVLKPKRKVPMTKAQALAAIERSRLKFTLSWDELRLATRDTKRISTYFPNVSLVSPPERPA